MPETNRRRFIQTFGLGAAAVLSGISINRCNRMQKRPNFLFILVDDLGGTDLGCYGSSFYETPNLDALAMGGMRFSDGYAAHPVCSPTRAAIMTGKNPARLGITDWIPGNNPKKRKLLGVDDQHRLPLKEVTVAETLKENGYKTFFAGKWHLNATGDSGFFPEDQGFDINRGGHHRGSPPGGYYSPYNNPRLDDGPEGEYLPDRLTDETIRFIESCSDRPFLAYLSFYTVHTPIQASRRHLAHYREKSLKLPETPPDRTEGDGFSKMRQDHPEYASMVHAMDENVGRLIDTLKKLGIENNTVIIFTSDNGGLSTLPRRGYPTSNLPFRAGKGWCYEGGIRVPLIIRAPGFTSSGLVCQEPVYSCDFYPTMLELAGLPGQPEQHVDGLSLVPLMNGEESLDRDAIIWHYPHYHGSAWKPGAAIRSGDWKLIEFYETGRAELYNLSEDIEENNDLSRSHPEKKKELWDLLRKKQKEMGAEFPRSNPDWQEKS